jgi:hypothetical protein
VFTRTCHWSLSAPHLVIISTRSQPKSRHSFIHLSIISFYQQTRFCQASLLCWNNRKNHVLVAYRERGENAPCILGHVTCTWVISLWEKSPQYRLDFRANLDVWREEKCLPLARSLLTDIPSVQGSEQSSYILNQLNRFHNRSCLVSEFIPSDTLLSKHVTTRLSYFLAVFYQSCRNMFA